MYTMPLPVPLLDCLIMLWSNSFLCGQKLNTVKSGKKLKRHGLLKELKTYNTDSVPQTVTCLNQVPTVWMSLQTQMYTTSSSVGKTVSPSPASPTTNLGSNQSSDSCARKKKEFKTSLRKLSEHPNSNALISWINIFLLTVPPQSGRIFRHHKLQKVPHSHWSPSSKPAKQLLLRIWETGQVPNPSPTQPVLCPSPVTPLFIVTEQEMRRQFKNKV